MKKTDRVITPKECAEDIGVPVGTVYSWIYHRKLKAKKWGSGWVVKTDDWYEFKDYVKPRWREER